MLKTFSTCILEAPLRVQETQTFRLRRQTNKKSTKDGANGILGLPLTLVSADDGSRVPAVLSSVAWAKRTIGDFLLPAAVGCCSAT